MMLYVEIDKDIEMICDLIEELQGIADISDNHCKCQKSGNREIGNFRDYCGPPGRSVERGIYGGLFASSRGKKWRINTGPPMSIRGFLCLFVSGCVFAFCVIV